MIDKNKGYYKVYLEIEGYSQFIRFYETKNKLPKDSLNKKLKESMPTLKKEEEKGIDELRKWFEDVFVPKIVEEFKLERIPHVINLNNDYITEICGYKLTLKDRKK